MRNLVLSLFIVVLSGIIFSPLHAQLKETNFSIQVGYHAKYFNPTPINYIIDSVYKSVRPNLTQGLDPIKWTSGFSAGLAYHKARTTIRVNAMLFGAQSHSLGPDSTGVSTRQDVNVAGSVVSLSIDGQLIEMYDDSYFCVGIGINYTDLNIEEGTVPADIYEKDTPLNKIGDRNKISFMLMTPFRFAITPQFKISLEPYYQISFSQYDFSDINDELNGVATATSTRLRGELDHFGVNLALMFYLQRR